MITKLQEFNSVVAQSQEAELISAVLTEKDIQYIKAGVECVVLNQQLISKYVFFFFFFFFFFFGSVATFSSRQQTYSLFIR
jgi:hypothetical protein